MASNILRRLVAMCALLPSTGAWANSYAIVDLGEYREPFGINGSGTVAVSFQPRHVEKWRAQVLRNGHWHRLDRSSTRAFGLSTGGTVGGGSSPIEGAPDGVPYTWTADDVRHGFELPGGATSGFVNGVTDTQAVGFYIPIEGVGGCFIAPSTGGQATDLGYFPGGSYCEARSVNDSGQVAGSADVALGVYHAFIWQDGALTDLGTLGGDQSDASAINDVGHVVGTARTAGGDQHAFLWMDSVMTDIGKASHYTSTSAVAVNNLDVAVGTAQFHRGSHAVRFEGGSVVELASEIVNLGSWKLRLATGINDDGYIVGWGSFAGHAHGFMLVPQVDRQSR